MCLDDEQAFAIESEDIIPVDKKRGDRSFYIAFLNTRTNVLFGENESG